MDFVLDEQLNRSALWVFFVLIQHTRVSIRRGWNNRYRLKDRVRENWKENAFFLTVFLIFLSIVDQKKRVSGWDRMKKHKRNRSDLSKCPISLFFNTQASSFLRAGDIERKREKIYAQLNWRCCDKNEEPINLHILIYHSIFSH